MDPRRELESKFRNIDTRDTILLPMVLSSLIFGLATFQFVVACSFVGPLFRNSEKDGATGRHHLTIPESTVNLLKAFTVIFWIVLGFSVLHLSTKRTPASIIWLAFTVVVAVGVGFLTAKIWKTKVKDDKVTLNLSKTQLVFIQIAIVGEIVIFSLALIAFMVFMFREVKKI